MIQKKATDILCTYCGKPATTTSEHNPVCVECKGKAKDGLQRKFEEAKD